jgi:hypothetical protein
MNPIGLRQPPILGLKPPPGGGSPPPLLPDAFLQQDGSSYFLLQNGVDRMIKQ